MTAAQDTEDLDPKIEAAVDKAYRQVENLCAFYNIKSEDDWNAIYQESPRIMARIQEIENLITGSTPINEVIDLLNKWVKNHESAFRRRSMQKKKDLIAG